MPRMSPATEARHEREAANLMKAIRVHLSSRPDGRVPTDLRPSAIAEATGIDRTTVSKILSGSRLPTYDQMRLLAEHVKLPLPHAGSVAPPPPGPVFPRSLQLGSDTELGDGVNDLSDAALELANPLLADYLKRRSAERKVTRRERYYLANTRVRLEPWIAIDDRYWDALLRFWRGYLEEADRATEVSAQMQLLDAAASEAWDDQMAEMKATVAEAMREVKAAHVRYREGKAGPEEMEAALEKMTAKAVGLRTFADQLAAPWESTDDAAPPARGRKAKAKK